MSTRHPSSTHQDVFHFVDGSLVTAEGSNRSRSPGRAGPSDASAASEPGAAVAEFLDRCAGGLARWLAMGPGARRQVLADVADGLVPFTFTIAEAVADDLGIPCELAVRRVSDGILRLQQGAARTASTRLPIGIQAIVVSRPLSTLMIADEIWPMLLGGSIAVVRPAPEYARASFSFVTSLSAAGLPDGVINVIHGDAGVMTALMGHPAVAGILAVGSSSHLAFVARSVSRIAKPTVLRAARS